MLQKPLHKGNIKTVVFVNLRCVPFAEAVGADPFIAEIITNKLYLLLDGSFGNRENMVVLFNAIPQAIVFYILLYDQRNSKNAAFACFLFYNLQAEAVAVPHDIVKVKV